MNNKEAEYFPRPRPAKFRQLMIENRISIRPERPGQYNKSERATYNLIGALLVRQQQILSMFNRQTLPEQYHGEYWEFEIDRVAERQRKQLALRYTPQYNDNVNMQLFSHFCDRACPCIINQRVLRTVPDPSLRTRP